MKEDRDFGCASSYDALARKRYEDELLGFLGKEVTVHIDRPIGYNHHGLIYPLNCGYIDGLLALDGEYQDAYVLGIEKAVDEAKGLVIAIVHREDDVEDKLVVSPDGRYFAAEEIENLVHFQEQFFTHRVILKKP